MSVNIAFVFYMGNLKFHSNSKLPTIWKIQCLLDFASRPCKAILEENTLGKVREETRGSFRSNMCGFQTYLKIANFAFVVLLT